MKAIDDAAAGPSPPLINRDNAAFHAGIQQRRLLIQRCVRCGTLQHPPGPMCGTCNHIGWEQQECSGRGVLHSFTIHRHPPIIGFPLPHPVGLADMAEGFRLLAGIHGVPLDEIAIGMRVKLEYAEVAPAYLLFRFVTDRSHDHPPAGTEAKAR